MSPIPYKIMKRVFKLHIDTNVPKRNSVRSSPPIQRLRNILYREKTDQIRKATKVHKINNK